MDGEVEEITADEVADGAADVVVAIVVAMVQNLSMTFVNSRLQLNFAYNKTLVEVIKTIEVWG